MTTITLKGPTNWTRHGIAHFFPNFTVTLHAVDDGNLSMIVLNDTGTLTTFSVHGNSSTVSITETRHGLHVMWYYSIDMAGNKEKPHLARAILAKHQQAGKEERDDDKLECNSDRENNFDCNRRESDHDTRVSAEDRQGIHHSTRSPDVSSQERGQDSWLSNLLVALAAIISAL